MTSELLVKLGIRIAPWTARKYMPKPPAGQPRGDQRWATFLKNHAKAILACDFFVAVTATFRLLYVFVVIEHGSRRLVRVDVTAHPSAEWTLLQLREVVGFDDIHRYLIHDRDSIFAKHLDESVKALGVTVLKSPPRSPKANAICERVIGTIRRACLDWLIPISEAHVGAILKCWVEQYNRGRPHSSLGPGAPGRPNIVECLVAVAQSDFPAERTLQRLIEHNLKSVFNFRFVATEFSTGSVHAGRIDSLALSEDGNPVIIEYKRVASSELINQSLFYLAWLQDHHGDFEIAAQKALGPNIDIDWSDIRVICLAPNYKKYDLHAVQVMGANIELWTYRLFANGVVYLEEIFQRAVGTPSPVEVGKDPIMVAAGKKAAMTRALGGWTFEQHIKSKPEPIRALVLAIQEYMMGLDPGMEEAPKKLYIAYRTTQNIACVEPQKQKILVFLKLDPAKHAGPPGIARNVSDIGHVGTGDLEIAIKTVADLELAKPYMKLAYEQVGG